MSKALQADFSLALCLIGVLAAIYWMTLRPGQDWGGDFAQYITHARNIAEGRPYGETRYLPTFADAMVHMPPAYPPVFPLLLAPIYAHYGLNYTPMKILTGGMFVLAALFVFLVARLRSLQPWLAATAALAFGLSGLVLGSKDLVLSDGTYLAFAGATLAAMMAAEDYGWDQSRPLLSAAAVLACMLAAYGTRSVGLSLALAFGSYQLLIKRRLTWFNALVLVGFGAGVALYTWAFFDSRSYANQFHASFRTYLDNTRTYLHSPAALWQQSPGAVRYSLVAITLFAAILAWLRDLALRPSVLDFYVLGAVVPPLLYSSANARYMLPVMAFYFVYFLEGAVVLGKRFALGGRAPAMACVLLFAGSAFNLRGMERGPYPEGVEQSSFTEVCDYIDRSLSRDALIVSWNPRVLALYTGRRTAWYPQDDGSAMLEDYLRQVGADYVLAYADNLQDAKVLEPSLLEAGNEYVLAYRNADFMLFRRQE